MICRPVIPGNGVGAAGQQFAGLADSDVVQVRVHQTNLVERRQWTALRIEHDLQRIVRAGVAQQALGHAEHLLYSAVQRFKQVGCQCRVQSRAADLQQLQAGQVAVFPIAPLGPELRQRRDQCHMGDAFALDQRHGRIATGAVAQYHRRTGGQTAEHAGAGEGEIVRGRQHGQVHAVAVQFTEPSRVGKVVGVVGVAARDQFWRAGGAA